MSITNDGKLNLFNAKYELDQRPIEEGCQCPACRHYSRAYIRHLLKAKEMLGMRLCVLHNLYFYNHMIGGNPGKPLMRAGTKRTRDRR